jgi:competence CoiA-like predicted nuclease
MSPSLQCKFYGHIINVDKALAVRDAAAPELKHSLPFECHVCGKPVRPRIAGDKHVAHFVHLQNSPECAYTDPPLEY